jgi:hypothetical protein
VAEHLRGDAVISWVVASHDRDVLAANLQPALDAAAAEGDEVLVVRDAPSIAAAYNQGRASAHGDLIAYVHHDVRVVDLPRLRAGLLFACRPDVGMVGVVGSRVPGWPWWDTGALCGSVIDSRMGRLDFSPGAQWAAVLDGLLLATSQPHAWDEGYAGWHGYDHDMCVQMLARGLANWCLPRGADLVEHHTTGSSDVSQLIGWDEAAERWHAKWTGGPVSVTAPEPSDAPPPEEYVIGVQADVQAQVQHHAPCVPECTVCYPKGEG